MIAVCKQGHVEATFPAWRTSILLVSPFIGSFFSLVFSSMNTWRNFRCSSHCWSFVFLAIFSLALHTKEPTLKTTLEPQLCFICLQRRSTCRKKPHLISYLPAITCPNRKLWKIRSSWRVDGNKTCTFAVFFLHAPPLFALLCLDVLPQSKHTQAAIYWCFCFITVFIDVCVSVWCVFAAAGTGIGNGAIRWIEYCHKPPSDHLFTSMHFSWEMKGHELKR